MNLTLLFPVLPPNLPSTPENHRVHARVEEVVHCRGLQVVAHPHPVQHQLEGVGLALPEGDAVPLPVRDGHGRGHVHQGGAQPGVVGQNAGADAENRAGRGENSISFLTLK